MGPGFESLTAYVEQYSDKKVNFVAIFVFYATYIGTGRQITLFAVKIAILQGKNFYVAFLKYCSHSAVTNKMLRYYNQPFCHNALFLKLVTTKFA